MPRYKNPKAVGLYKQESEMLCYLALGVPSQALEASTQLPDRLPTWVWINEINRRYVNQIVRFNSRRDTGLALVRLEQQGLAIRRAYVPSEDKPKHRSEGGRRGFEWRLNTEDDRAMSTILSRLDELDGKLFYLLLRSPMAARIQKIARRALESRIDSVADFEGKIFINLGDQSEGPADFNEFLRESNWRYLLEDITRTAPSFLKDLILTEFNFESYRRALNLSNAEALQLLVVSYRIRDVMNGRADPERLNLDLLELKGRFSTDKIRNKLDTQELKKLLKKVKNKKEVGRRRDEC